MFVTSPYYQFQFAIGMASIELSNTLFQLLVFSVNSDQTSKDMTTLDLRKQLIQRISEIEDNAFLEAIKTILDSNSQILHLTAEQRAEILKSKDQIDQGLFTSKDQLDEEFEKWGLDKLSHKQAKTDLVTLGQNQTF